MIEEFEEVRNWAKIRGVDGATTDIQYQRFLQEAIEIHEAIIHGDIDEFKDAIGDTIITLINLARTQEVLAEECLHDAFYVIERRKGLTTPNGDFIRYAKLSAEDRLICDEQQGNIGDEYWEFEPVVEDFKK